MSLTLRFKTPRPRNIFVTTRTYKNYDRNGFIDDLANVPFHIVDLFDDPDDQVNAFNYLFLQVLDEYAPIKRIRIKSRPNPFITPDIKGLMNTRDMWHKKAMKTNDKLHWNAYRFFRQEVKREIKLAEKEHVRSEILKSNGNSNSIWKIINRRLPKKNAPLAAVANPLLLANKLNEFYANVRKVTALKATNLAEQHNLNIWAQREFIRVNPFAALVKILLPCLRFTPSLRVMCRGLLRVYRLTKLPVAIK